MSLSAVGTSLAFSSPMRSREHTSEAGSPTLEQVLLMSKSKSPSQNTDYGYGSMVQDYSGDGLYSSFKSSSVDINKNEFDVFSSKEQSGRPSFSEIVGIDIAVAEAVQNLQVLKQKQVAIHHEFGFNNASSSNNSYSNGKLNRKFVQVFTLA